MIKTTADRATRTVAIQFKDQASVTLSETEARQLVSNVAALLADLAIGIPPPELEGVQVGAIFNPRWFTQRDLQHGLSILSFHHPGFGPVAFALPPEEAESLARLLLRQIEIGRHEPGTSN